MALYMYILCSLQHFLPPSYPAAPCVSVQSSPSSSEPHPPTLPGESCTLNTAFSSYSASTFILFLQLQPPAPQQRLFHFQRHHLHQQYHSVRPPHSGTDCMCIYAPSSALLFHHAAVCCVFPSFLCPLSLLPVPSLPLPRLMASGPPTAYPQEQQ